MSETNERKDDPLHLVVMWALEHGLATGHADTLQELLEELGCQVDQMSSKIFALRQWADAYPLDIFPEPDFKKAREGLASVGITLDSVSASNMRHVIIGVKDILNT